jgi:hypothetical protein
MRKYYRRKYIIDEKNKVIFTNIPKSGCSSLRTMVLKRNNEFVNYNCIWTKKMEKYLKYDNLDMKKYKNYKKIVIVRNPFNRAMSCYRDKVLNNDLGQQLNIIKDMCQNKKERVSFKEFIDYLYNNRNVLDVHTQPQTKLIQYVGEFEILKLEDPNTKLRLKSLGYEYEKINGINNYKNIKTYILPKENEDLYNKKYSFFKEKIEKQFFYDYKYFYNEDIIKKVIDIYQDDFKNFNYSTTI